MQRCINFSTFNLHLTYFLESSNLLNMSPSSFLELSFALLLTQVHALLLHSLFVMFTLTTAFSFESELISQFYHLRGTNYHLLFQLIVPSDVQKLLDTYRQHLKHGLYIPLLF